MTHVTLRNAMNDASGRNTGLDLVELTTGRGGRDARAIGRP